MAVTGLPTVTGYPEASLVGKTHGRRLSDEFLEDIARVYLECGPGYAKKMAAAQSTSSLHRVHRDHSAA